MPGPVGRHLRISSPAVRTKRLFAPHRGQSVCLALLLLVACTTATAADDAAWSIAPLPNWVTPIEPFSSTPAPEVETERPRGIDMRLYERQVDLRGSASAFWSATEYAFVTRQGVADRSRLEIQFDPAYQTLELNELAIQRNGVTVDRLSEARVRVLDLEPERRAALYHGKRTLSILLDDVRVGDVLRYSYTRTGQNPVLGGLREHSFATERRWKTDGRARWRVLSDVDAPLYVRVHGTAATPVEHVLGGVRETVLDLPSVPARRRETGLPAHARALGRVTVSDVADWARIVEWARPMYALSRPAPTEIVTVADRVRQAGSDERTRIGAALRWVQEEVRYFGIELGADSHRPASPSETLRRRFGDCKAKALLFVALLAELGIESHVALVDTTGSLTSSGSSYRLHAFDHVIVRVFRDGISHWLDPTDSHQLGALGEIGEPDYGAALVLAADVDGLEDMTPTRLVPGPFVDKRLVVPAEVGERATLEVRTRWPPARADRLRARFEREGARAIGDDYLAYYKDVFDEAERLAPVEALEREDGGLDVVERYAVPFWTEGKAGRRWHWLRSDEIKSELDDPPSANRRIGPYSLEALRPLRERWTVELPRPGTLTRVDSTLDTPWFQFRRTHTIDPTGKTHVIDARFDPLVEEVSPDALADYATAVDRLSDVTWFHIADEPPFRKGTTHLDRLADALYARRETVWKVLGLLGLGLVCALMVRERRVGW